MKIFYRTGVLTLLTFRIAIRDVVPALTDNSETGTRNFDLVNIAVKNRI